MKINIPHIAAALLLSAIHCQLSTALAQGPLTPPGAPAPTMKTLDQIEARTPISSAPFTISNPGSYYLTANLTVSGGDAIIIATSGVTLDLNGFTITSTAPSAAGNGIHIYNDLRNLVILNGFIRGGVTNNGSGVYSGSGFGSGIFGYKQNARVSGVSVAGCLDDGIFLGLGDSTVVESRTVRTVGGNGILAATIKAAVAKDCGNTAINGDQVADCRGESSGSGDGLFAGKTALECYGASSSGYGLRATTAQNCYGTSSSGSYPGLYANTALNCYGNNSSSYTGLHAITAQNCYGISGSGYGLIAFTAQNCYGSSTSGGSYGLYANSIAIGCYGTSGGSGTGLHATIANTCIGDSSSGTGLTATYGNFCFGTSVAVTTKYNMP